jgi:electron transfer flavoprotein alpha subunit
MSADLHSESSMTILVIAEHCNTALDPSTYRAVGAAALIATFSGQDVHVLVAGRDAAEAATRIAGVSKVMVADFLPGDRNLEEATEVTIMNIAHDYSHILAPTTAYGTRLADGVSRRLGVAPLISVTKVFNAETFERSVAAEKECAAAPSRKEISVITVDVESFGAAASEGGAATLAKLYRKREIPHT